jgi:hypothetical protein
MRQRQSEIAGIEPQLLNEILDPAYKRIQQSDQNTFAGFKGVWARLEPLEQSNAAHNQAIKHLRLTVMVQTILLVLLLAAVAYMYVHFIRH